MATEPLAFPPAAPDDPWGETPLAELPVVAFDTETGGLDAFKDPLLTVGVAHPEGLILEALIANDNYQPSEKALEVNRITGARAAEGLPWLLLEELLANAFDGRVLLAHNAGFDLSYLVANAPNLALPAAIDTAAVSRFLWPGQKADLANVCMRARVEQGDAHSAGADALAAARCWLFMRAALRNKGIETWNQLCAAAATIPPAFTRPAWPDQVAAAHAKAQTLGGVPRHGRQAAS